MAWILSLLALGDGCYCLARRDTGLVAPVWAETAVIGYLLAGLRRGLLCECAVRGEALAMASSDLPREAGPDGARVVAMLRELAELTGDEAGAQRVAWTDVWQRARAFLREQLRGLPVTIRTDAAGNQWARLPGGGGGVVIIGSHLDSVPDGGWLDGAYGVM
jgi:hypothetical protein